MARPVPGAVVIVFVLLFILLNPSVQPISITQLNQIRASIAGERVNLEVLRNSCYGDFVPLASGGGMNLAEDENGPSEDGIAWLNLTGFREDDGYIWELLPQAQERAKAQFEHEAGTTGLGILYGKGNGSLVLYQNVSGWMNGRWVRSSAEEDLSFPVVNLSAIAPEVDYPNLVYGRNITGLEGKVQLRMNERQQIDGLSGGKGPLMHVVSARLTLQDETSSADGWTTALHGVHYVQSGSLLLTTTSEKFAGIFALPHLALSQHFAELAKAALNVSLTATIHDQEHDPEGSSERPWTSDTMSVDYPTQPLCELVVYLQQQPTHLASSNEGGESIDEDLSSVFDLEEELRFPTGTALTTPPLAMSMIVFSPDCGFILESKGPPNFAPQEGDHLQGPKIEKYIGSTKTVIMLFGLVITGQLLLQVKQMKETTTPSTRGRISFYTLAIMSLGTGFVGFSFLFLSSILSSTFLASMTLTFVAFLDGTFFGMKFLLDVWTAHEPERAERERRNQQRRAAALAGRITAVVGDVPPSPDPAPSAAEGLPLPVTQPRPIDTSATQFALPQIQTAPPPTTAPTTTTTITPPMRPATFGAVYTRYWLLLLTIIFLSGHALTSWPLPLRTFYANTLSLLYLSLWLPQIYRNIFRNCRHAFSWLFILGQSTLRLVPFAYLWCIDGNVLFVETDIRMFGVMVGWMWCQVCVLAAQEVLGPRCFVSEKWKWVPIGWDYHRVLREDEDGAGLPIGSNPISSPVDDRRPSFDGLSRKSRMGRYGGNSRSFDCAICMQSIEVPVVPIGGRDDTTAGLRGSRLFLERRKYMISPCRHIFHTECLERWIGYRLQCPICRETLPPL